MSRTVTLALLRSQIREMADNQDVGDDQSVTDTRLNEMINASYGIWQGMLAKAVPERFEAVDTITGDGSSGYNLPADYVTTLAVEYQTDTNDYIDLRRVMFNERNMFSGQATSGQALGYRVNATQVLLLPPPSSGTYRHIYTTMADVLAADGDTVDGINGWEKWLVLDVAIQLLLKEESDVGQFVQERNKIQFDMKEAGNDRNSAAPRRVVDVRSRRALGRRRDPDFPTF